MEWNTIIPFVGFGGIITIATILYKFSYKNGRQDCRLDILEKRVFTNEEKSISSTNSMNSSISELKDIIKTSLVENNETLNKTFDRRFAEVNNNITEVKESVKGLEGRVTNLEQKNIYRTKE